MTWECCGSVSEKAVSDCKSMIAYLLELWRIHSGRKKEKAWTGKLIGRDLT
jgi:hypothetical protein